ncbi:TolC family protein [Telluribacter sp. SYSU D00476]|uniref:TolC family protein n=1 Tax=Telluribacter sp. SYSU D00476 TaxID=2811430 RepID=UPI001FF3CA88|nr:TolC family protein [Telluribacter sp. SYSU D00476]
MKKYLLIGCLLIGGSAAHAQTILHNVEEALTLARRHNPDLQAARQTAQWQAGAVDVAKAGRLPTLRATSSLDYNYALPVQLVPAEFLGGRPGEYQRLQFGVPYNLTAGLEANYGLLNPTLSHDIRLADLNQQVAEAQVAAQQDQLATQVVRAYYLTALAREAMQISEVNLRNADTLLILARERYNAGVTEQLDLNRTQSTRLSLADQLEQNRLAYTNNLRQLNLLVGQEVLVPADAAKGWAVNEELPAATTPDDYPQIRLKASQLNYFQAAIQREQATRLPQLSLYGRYSAQAQRREFNFLDFEKPWFSIGVVGIRLDVPIYNGGIRLLNIARAKIRADIARTEMEAERRRQLAQDEEWQTSFAQARRSLALSRENLDLSTQNLDLALLKYQAGTYTYDQYLTVFNESLQTQNRYLRTLADAMIYGGLLRTRP